MAGVTAQELFGPESYEEEEEEKEQLVEEHNQLYYPTPDGVETVGSLLWGYINSANKSKEHIQIQAASPLLGAIFRVMDPPTSTNPNSHSRLFFIMRFTRETGAYKYAVFCTRDIIMPPHEATPSWTDILSLLQGQPADAGSDSAFTLYGTTLDEDGYQSLSSIMPDYYKTLTWQRSTEVADSHFEVGAMREPTKLYTRQYVHDDMLEVHGLLRPNMGPEHVSPDVLVEPPVQLEAPTLSPASPTTPMQQVEPPTAAPSPKPARGPSPPVVRVVGPPPPSLPPSAVHRAPTPKPAPSTQPASSLPGYDVFLEMLDTNTSESKRIALIRGSFKPNIQEWARRGHYAELQQLSDSFVSIGGQYLAYAYLYEVFDDAQNVRYNIGPLMRNKEVTTLLAETTTAANRYSSLIVLDQYTPVSERFGIDCILARYILANVDKKYRSEIRRIFRHRNISHDDAACEEERREKQAKEAQERERIAKRKEATAARDKGAREKPDVVPPVPQEATEAITIPVPLTAEIAPAPGEIMAALHGNDVAALAKEETMIARARQNTEEERAEEVDASIKATVAGTAALPRSVQESAQNALAEIERRVGTRGRLVEPIVRAFKKGGRATSDDYRAALWVALGPSKTDKLTQNALNEIRNSFNDKERANTIITDAVFTYKTDGKGRLAGKARRAPGETETEVTRESIIRILDEFRDEDGHITDAYAREYSILQERFEEDPRKSMILERALSDEDYTEVTLRIDVLGEHTEPGRKRKREDEAAEAAAAAAAETGERPPKKPRASLTPPPSGSRAHPHYAALDASARAIARDLLRDGGHAFHAALRPVMPLTTAASPASHRSPLAVQIRALFAAQLPDPGTRFCEADHLAVCIAHVLCYYKAAALSAKRQPSVPVSMEALARAARATRAYNAAPCADLHHPYASQDEFAAHVAAYAQNLARRVQQRRGRRLESDSMSSSECGSDSSSRSGGEGGSGDGDDSGSDNEGCDMQATPAVEYGPGVSAALATLVNVMRAAGVLCSDEAAVRACVLQSVSEMRASYARFVGLKLKDTGQVGYIAPPVRLGFDQRRVPPVGNLSSIVCPSNATIAGLAKLHPVCGVRHFQQACMHAAAPLASSDASASASASELCDVIIQKYICPDMLATRSRPNKDKSTTGAALDSILSKLLPACVPGFPKTALRVVANEMVFSNTLVDVRISSACSDDGDQLMMDDGSSDDRECGRVCDVTGWPIDRNAARVQLILTECRAQLLSETDTAVHSVVYDVTVHDSVCCLLLCLYGMRMQLLAGAIDHPKWAGVYSMCRAHVVSTCAA